MCIKLAPVNFISILHTKMQENLPFQTHLFQLQNTSPSLFNSGYLLNFSEHGLLSQYNKNLHDNKVGVKYFMQPNPEYLKHNVEKLPQENLGGLEFISSSLLLPPISICIKSN